MSTGTYLTRLAAAVCTSVVVLGGFLLALGSTAAPAFTYSYAPSAVITPAGHREHVAHEEHLAALHAWHVAHLAHVRRLLWLHMLYSG